MSHRPRRTRKVARAAFGALLAVALLAGCGHLHRQPLSAMEERVRVEERVIKFVDHLLKEVDATEEQRQKVYPIRDRLMPDIVAWAADRSAAKKELRDLLDQPALDTAKLDALVDRGTDATQALAHKLVAATAEVHLILTPEQREKLRKRSERYLE